MELSGKTSELLVVVKGNERDIMNPDYNTKRLHRTSDPHKIVEALMMCADMRKLSVTKYSVISQNDATTIISNVPDRIYKIEKPQRYIAPPLSNTNKRLIAFLQSNIDTLQYTEVPDPNALGKGETFSLNQCYNNSKRLFQFLIHLGTIEVIPKEYKIKIALGYIACKIPFGTNIGDIIVNSHGLILHDWHTWDYIDKILIDLSLFKNGNMLPFGSEIPSWGSAKDHVFGAPPNSISYFGRVYGDLDNFDAKIQMYFPQQMQDITLFKKID